MRAVRIKHNLSFPSPFGGWGCGNWGRHAEAVIGPKRVNLCPGLVDLGVLRDLCADKRLEFVADRKRRGQL